MKWYYVILMVSIIFMAIRFMEIGIDVHTRGLFPIISGFLFFIFIGALLEHRFLGED